MPTDPFAGRDYVEIENCWGQIVTLHRETWARKIRKHSEHYLVYNYDKIVDTLASPDSVVRSRQYADTLLYYKRYSHFNIREGIEVPSQDKPFLMVVVKQGQLIQSFYRVENVSPGEVVWP